MMLPLVDTLIVTTPFDADCAALADRHYSRRTHGSPQFAGSGRKIVLRDCAGLVLFVWKWDVDLVHRPRWDGEVGYNNVLFRNESKRVASGIILEAERHAVEKWGPNRGFTYIDPRKVPATMVRGYPVWGWCFYKAGWSFVRLSKDGKHLLAKELL
jgi:hypothetical protein